jgi:hypothetical protein
MAQQDDPWAWTNPTPTAPLAASIQPSQEQAPPPARSVPDPMLGMAQSAVINKAPAMWDAGKAAYIDAVTPSAPLAASAIPMEGATTTMAALAAPPLAVAPAAATGAAIAGTEAAVTGGMMAAAPAVAGGMGAGMSAAAPAAMAALGPAALIPLGLFAASKIVKGK